MKSKATDCEAPSYQDARTDIRPTGPSRAGWTEAAQLSRYTRHEVKRHMRGCGCEFGVFSSSEFRGCFEGVSSTALWSLASVNLHHCQVTRFRQAKLVRLMRGG